MAFTHWLYLHVSSIVTIPSIPKVKLQRLEYCEWGPLKLIKGLSIPWSPSQLFQELGELSSCPSMGSWPVFTELIQFKFRSPGTILHIKIRFLDDQIHQTRAFLQSYDGKSHQGFVCGYRGHKSDNWLTFLPPEGEFVFGEFCGQNRAVKPSIYSVHASFSPFSIAWKMSPDVQTKP